MIMTLLVSRARVCIWDLLYFPRGAALESADPDTAVPRALWSGWYMPFNTCDILTSSLAFQAPCLRFVLSC